MGPAPVGPIAVGAPSLRIGTRRPSISSLPLAWSSPVGKEGEVVGVLGFRRTYRFRWRRAPSFPLAVCPVSHELELGHVVV